MNTRWLAAATLLLSVAASADTFLVPIYLPNPISGAFGSLWTSELRVLNTGGTTVAIDNVGIGCSTDPCGKAPIPAGKTTSIASITNWLGGSSPGALLFVADATAPQLLFELRVRDLSASVTSWGTWVPVVHEADAVAGALELFDVPLRSGYRQTVRVYAFDRAMIGQRVRVTIFGIRPTDPLAPADAQIGQLDLTLFGAQSSQAPYGELNDLLALIGATGYDTVRVRVEPVGAFKIWALASVTNNATQEVTMIAPNRRTGE